MEYEIKGVNNFSRRSKRKNSTVDEELEYWMTRLPEALKSLPIIRLAIPGKFQNIFSFYENLY